jgi:hypothetical protein
MNEDAANQVKGPAVGLMVAAGIGGLFQLLSLVLRVLGTGIGMMGNSSSAYGHMLSGGVGIVVSLIGLATTGFIIWGAMQMMSLQNYTISMAASVVAMVPCVSPCCLLGLPVGIWALVILMKPEVKAAFVG